MKLYTLFMSAQKTKLVILFLCIIIVIFTTLKIIESQQFRNISPVRKITLANSQPTLRSPTPWPVKYIYGPARVPYISEDKFNIPLNNNKYIIYKCGGNGLCGGLADRLEGIVASYLISQMLRRKFGIHFTVPCDLSLNLVPNLVDWVVDYGKINTKSIRNIYVIDKAGWNLREDMSTMDLNKTYPEDAVFFKLNQESVQYLMKNELFKTVTWAQNLKVPDIYNVVYRRLFKLSTKLDPQFYKFQANARRNNRKLVCTQMRMWRNPTIPHDFDPKVKLNTSLVWNFLKKYNDSSKYSIFVSTDSEDVRKTGAKLFPEAIVDISGSIVHIEQTHGQLACSGFSKVILDQLVLSTCDVLVLTSSGIGRIASFLRGTGEELYCTTKVDVKPCSIYDPDFIPFGW